MDAVLDVLNINTWTEKHIALPSKKKSSLRNWFLEGDELASNSPTSIYPAQALIPRGQFLIRGEVLQKLSSSFPTGLNVLTELNEFAIVEV